MVAASLYVPLHMTCKLESNNTIYTCDKTAYNAPNLLLNIGVVCGIAVLISIIRTILPVLGGDQVRTSTSTRLRANNKHYLPRRTETRNQNNSTCENENLVKSSWGNSYTIEYMIRVSHCSLLIKLCVIKMLIYISVVIGEPPDPARGVLIEFDIYKVVFWIFTQHCLFEADFNF